jgi:hypothetical protein
MANLISPGDFAVVPISGAGGKLVEFGEFLNGSGFTHYEHAEIYTGGATDKHPYGFTFGAYPGGADCKPLLCPPQALPGALWSSGRITLTDQQRASVLAQCQALKGTPYSALDYFALAAHHLHLPVPGLEHYIQDTGHLICSQLVDQVYLQAGLHLFRDGRWPGYVTPADLATLIETGLSFA